ncbi:hypothetical protein [Persicobacter sp. CCB-QB2]|uniref:hypothetical protein n=1 Tax=Persicobacter sp. CCB-QB2 TaxID=1561025 RepID=UPI0006A9E8DA|nr:hypothetical protein [Persicobacter sp. CCB-QB2]
MSKKEEKFVVPEAHKGQVEAWKKKHGRIKYFTFDGVSLFFKMPSRQQLSAAEAIAQNEDGTFDLTKKTDQLMVDCFLGGDMTREQIDADIEVYTSLVGFCNSKLVEAKNASWGSC